MPKTRPSIPELINFIRHLFRESEFEDELQNALLEREKKMQTEVEKLVKVRDLMKKKIDFLEYSLEEKLGVSEKRCEESDKENFRLREQIGTLMQEKLCIEEKFEMSHKKCEDMRLEKCSLEEKLGRREKRCEELEEENVGLREKIGILMHEEFVTEKRCENMECRLARMENTRSITVLEKCIQEEKLRGSERRCEELEEEIVGLREKIGMSTHEKSKLEKCEDSFGEMEKNERLMVIEKCRLEEQIGMLVHEKSVMEEKFEMSCKKCEDMEKEIEEMRLDKLNANRTTEELKLKSVEANQTIDELRVKMVELESGVILMLERRLAKKLSLDVEDVRFLLRDLDGPICDEEVNGNAKDRGEVGHAGGDAVVIESDNDEKEDANKRSRTETAEDWGSRKKRANTCLDDFKDVESTDSDDESCSDMDMDKFIETLRQRRKS